MIYPSADKLENWGSKYSLVVLAAKRAKQLKQGAPPLIHTTSRNPLTIALEEIAAGVILCQVADHDILPKTSQEVEVAQLLAIPTLALEEEEGEAADNETASVFSDDVELEEEVDEEDEEAAAVDVIIQGDDSAHEPVFVEEEEEEEEHFEDDADADDEPAESAEEADLLAPEAPKPKRGRKKKVDPDVISLEELEPPDEDEDASEE